MNGYHKTIKNTGILMLQWCEIMIWYSGSRCNNVSIDKTRVPIRIYRMFAQRLSIRKWLCKDIIWRFRLLLEIKNQYKTCNRSRKHISINYMVIYKHCITIYYKKGRMWVKVNHASTSRVKLHVRLFLCRWHWYYRKCKWWRRNT